MLPSLQSFGECVHWPALHASIVQPSASSQFAAVVQPAASNNAATVWSLGGVVVFVRQTASRRGCMPAGFTSRFSTTSVCDPAAIVPMGSALIVPLAALPSPSQ
jgi:hypothetical protein